MRSYRCLYNVMNITSFYKRIPFSSILGVICHSPSRVDGCGVLSSRQPVVVPIILSPARNEVELYIIIS